MHCLQSSMWKNTFKAWIWPDWSDTKAFPHSSPGAEAELSVNLLEEQLLV